MLYGLLITKIVENLKNKLMSGRIQKIYQLNDNELVFKVRANHTNYNLLNSIQADDFRLHVTNNKITALEEATNFCMLLRKHLEGGIIKEIKQQQCERIIIFEILKMSALKDVDTKYLIFELLGRHSNTILTDGNFKIIQTFKSIPLHQGITRIFQQGAIYEPIDSKGKINPYDHFKKSTDYAATYQGFSKEISNEFLEYQQANYQAKTILELYQNSKECYLYDKFLSYLRPLTKEYRVYEDLDEAFDALYQHESAQQSISTIYHKELRAIKTGLKRNNRKQKKLEQQYQDNLDYQKYQKRGTLLYDNLYQFQKNAHFGEVNVYDFREQKNITIPLDNRLSYLENAQNYLKKYRKKKKSFTYLADQIKQARDSSYLFQEALAMVNYASIEDFLEMLIELDRLKLINLNHKRKKGTHNKNKELNYSCFKDEAENKYYVGKNALQNNLLTFKLAKPNDLWIHVKDQAGAHVIVKGVSNDPAVINKAARLALLYSNTAINTNYEVQYTKIANLAKLNEQLGQVKLKTYKSMIVNNDGNILKELEQLK